MTVRSVLLNRDSPDIESRLKRRRNRTQQVRFKDLVEAGAGRADSPPPGPGHNTPRASPPPRAPPEPAALRASRRSWPQAQPGSLTLPMPRKACMSTAIQTSPSLQKPFPAPQPRSKSVCDVAEDAVLPAAANARCPGAAVATVAGWAVSPRAPGGLPSRDHPAGLAQQAKVRRTPPPPPPRDPPPPYQGTARCAPPGQSCTPEPCPPPPACAQLRGSPRGSHGVTPRPASVPCGQSRPPPEQRGLGRSDSERSLPRPAPPCPPSPHRRQPGPATDTQSVRQPPQGNPPRDPPPPQHQLCAALWGGPCCASPAPAPPAPGWHSSATPDKTPAAPGTCSRLRAAEPGHGWAGPEGPREPPSAAQKGSGVGTKAAGWAEEAPRHGQPDTLHHVQDLLQLVVVAKAPVGPPARDEDARTSQGEGPRGPGEQGDLHSQLQSLEGVLETSQQTIRVLLDVIQDLEKKEAQRDG